MTLPPAQVHRRLYVPSNIDRKETSVIYNFFSCSQISAPIDFTALTGLLTFTPTNTRETVRIQIINDSYDETVERFLGQLTLVTTGVMVQLSPQETEILIIDDDRMSFSRFIVCICIYSNIMMQPSFSRNYCWL